MRKIITQEDIFIELKPTKTIYRNNYSIWHNKKVNGGEEKKVCVLRMCRSIEIVIHFHKNKNKSLQNNTQIHNFHFFLFSWKCLVHVLELYRQEKEEEEKKIRKKYLIVHRTLKTSIWLICYRLNFNPVNKVLIEFLLFSFVNISYQLVRNNVVLSGFEFEFEFKVWIRTQRIFFSFYLHLIYSIQMILYYSWSFYITSMTVYLKQQSPSSTSIQCISAYFLAKCSF